MGNRLFSTVFLGFCGGMPDFRRFLGSRTTETRIWSGFDAFGFLNPFPRHLRKRVGGSFSIPISHTLCKASLN